MEREVAGESVDQLNPKTGQGGLVDVEFATQYLQLLHGAALPRCGSPGPWTALAALAAGGKAAPGGRCRPPRGVPLPPPRREPSAAGARPAAASASPPAVDRCCCSHGGWVTADLTPAVRSCRNTARSRPPCARPTSVFSSSERGRKEGQVAPTDPVHVLVVDDDRNVQRMLADALTRGRFPGDGESGTGEAALAAFERQTFDVVLLDVLAPGAERLRGRPANQEHSPRRAGPGADAVGIYKTKMHQAQAVERHGAAGFVEKPFKLNQLFGKLEGVLGDRFPKPPPLAPSNGSPEPASEPLADPRAQAEASLVEFTAESSAPSRRRRGRETAPRPASAPAVRPGTFATRAFPELLADLQRRRASGGLLLRRDKVKKIVFFRGGVPESVKSNRLSECLGRVMVRERDDLRGGLRGVPETDEDLGAPAGHGADRDGLHQPSQPPLRPGAAAAAEAARGVRLGQGRVPVQTPGRSRPRRRCACRCPPRASSTRASSGATTLAASSRRSGRSPASTCTPAEDPLFAAQDMSLGRGERVCWR
jgi:CheY-like chemotaxis protein